MCKYINGGTNTSDSVVDKFFTGTSTSKSNICLWSCSEHVLTT